MAEVVENLNTQAPEEPIKPEVGATELVVHDDGEFAMLFDSARFNQAQRVAKLFANSGLVPAHFRGKTTDVFVALHMSTRMQLDPYMLMQNTYVVHGRPGMEAKLQIALVNSRGPFRGPIKWEFSGKNEDKTRSCTAYAIHKITGERHSFMVDWKMVQAEKWDKKDGSKWLTIPDLMFMYRSASFLIKTTCPEVTMGLPTVEELQDMDVIEAEVVTPAPAIEPPKQTQTASIKDELKQRRTRKTPETPQTDPAGEANSSPASGAEGTPTAPSPGPRGVTDEQLAYLKKVPQDLIVRAFDFCNLDPLALEEMDYDSADRMITWCREQ